MKVRLKPIRDQVVVVFGASSGIGRETAKRFAARGAKVVVSARTDEGLATLVEEIRHAGGEAMAIPADVTIFEHVRAVAEQTVERYGRLDTWAHVAGVAAYGLFDELTPEEFKRVIDTDCIGLAYGAMAALPYLKANGGAFIGVTSIAGARALPLLSAYSAAKHAGVGLLEALRLELKHEGAPVSVTNILPSSMNTPFFNNALSKIGVKPKGVPPIYQPYVAADAILYAAEHPVRDIVVGGAGKMLVGMQRVSPRLMDTLLGPVAVPLQKTTEEQAPDAPNSLFAPERTDSRVEGDFAKESLPYSLSDWLEFHPLVRRAALAGAAVSVATVRALRAGKASDGARPIADEFTTNVPAPTETANHA